MKGCLLSAFIFIFKYCRALHRRPSSRSVLAVLLTCGWQFSLFRQVTNHMPVAPLLFSWVMFGHLRTWKTLIVDIQKLLFYTHLFLEVMTQSWIKVIVRVVLCLEAVIFLVECLYLILVSLVGFIQDFNSYLKFAWNMAICFSRCPFNWMYCANSRPFYIYQTYNSYLTCPVCLSVSKKNNCFFIYSIDKICCTFCTRLFFVSSFFFCSHQLICPKKI